MSTSYFIISKHNCNQTGIRSNCIFHLSSCNIPLCSHIQKLNLKSLLLQPSQSMKHRMMLKRSRNNMPLILFRPKHSR